MTVEHRGALEYELMTRTVYTLDDLGGGLSWPALFSFIRYLPPGALSDDPEVRAWYGGARTADLLADLIDIYLAAHTKEGRKAPTVKRPAEKHEIKKHVGSDAIKIADFDAWWNGGANG